MELAKIRELQNSILEISSILQVLEIEPTGYNPTEIIDSLEPFTNFDDFDAEDEQLKIKANGRKKVIRTCFTLWRFCLWLFWR